VESPGRPHLFKTAKIQRFAHARLQDYFVMYLKMAYSKYGRFLSPDPARDQHFEDTQSWNIYSYVRNQPVTNIDPTGMLAFQRRTKGNDPSDPGFWDASPTDQTKKDNSAQTKTDTATISLVSRPIDTRDLPWWQKWLGGVDHAGWVIESKDASYVIQSGPNDKTGQNEANKVVSTAPGKGQFEFSQVTDKKGETITARVNVMLTFKVSADAVSVDKLQGLVKSWNDKGIKYNPYPGPNSNTFAHWFGSQMNLGSMQKNGYGLVHSLPGWGYLDQVR
jgi:RHS repeat-associated protein